jgi:hypothetical protein
MTAPPASWPDGRPLEHTCIDCQRGYVFHHGPCPAHRAPTTSEPVAKPHTQAETEEIPW